MNKSRLGRIFLILFFPLLGLNLWIIFSGNSYLYRAIWHNFADIDDNKIFPSRVIKAGVLEPWPISKFYNKKKLPANLERELEKIASIGFLIIKNDSIINESYWGGYSDTSFSNSFSMAKTFVSMSIGVAVDKGFIKSIDEPVFHYLPQFANDERSKQLTIRHLLTMTSGSNWVESYSNPLSITTKAYYGSRLEEVIQSIQIIKDPGTQFHYQSGNNLLLAAVLEKATGHKLADYFSSEIWSKAGTSRNALWSLDREGGTEKAYCCVYSNARDFARMGQLYLNGGRYKDKQLVSEEYVKKSLLPVKTQDAQGKPVNYYGLSWWLIPQYKGHNVFYARGILGQYVIVVPEEKIIIVRLGKKRGPVQGDHYQEVFDCIDAALAMYGEKQ